MKSFFLLLAIIWIMLSTPHGYANTKADTTSISETNYYGADLTPFPPKVRAWIMNKAYTKERMEKPYMINPELKVWWREDNNAVLTEASYIIADGYKGAGTIKTWGQGNRYPGQTKIVETYGKYAKYHTLKYKWELKQEVEWLLQNDTAYAEIIDFAKQMCDEMEYDWRNFKGYKGPVKRTPGKKYAVCEGYADEVMSKILELDCVESVQKWSSSGHAWNVLKLTDGRTLYLDLTWFDNEFINEKTGEIYQTDDYDWADITFNEDLFRHSGMGYGSRIFDHDIGKLVKEKRKDEEELIVSEVRPKRVMPVKPIKQAEETITSLRLLSIKQAEGQITSKKNGQDLQSRKSREKTKYFNFMNYFDSLLLLFGSYVFIVLALIIVTRVLWLWVVVEMARQRGRTQVGWFFVAFFLPLSFFAGMCLSFLGDTKKRRFERLLEEQRFLRKHLDDDDGSRIVKRLQEKEKEEGHPWDFRR